MTGLRVNFCETNVMSVCNALEKNLQKHCRFYGKSSYGDHCMFFHFDQYCDSPEAQKHARNLEKDLRHIRENKISLNCQPESEFFL